VGYIHVEIEHCQSPKRPAAPCGDVLVWERTAGATTITCSDGIGSGIRANIAATMCVSRLMELLRRGFSPRNAFASMVRTMEGWRDPSLPYAVFTIVRILNDGQATILSYEMPPPIFVGARHAAVLTPQSLQIEGIFAGEANCYIEPGEGVIVVSDGASQAGLGHGLRHGWQIEGVCRFVNDCLIEGAELKAIPRLVHQKAREYDGTSAGDDCTAIVAACRWGKMVNVLTGPPADRSQDRSVVKQFMAMEGAKVVCGGTTSQIVADCLARPIAVEQNPDLALAPPRYMIDGIDLVTEGAVTLNQAYNILEVDPTTLEEQSGVTEMVDLLRSADRVNFMVGVAPNPASGDITFRQMGILERDKIVPLIAEKLRIAGKLVVVDYH
jgi:hypothetical protein